MGIRTSIGKADQGKTAKRWRRLLRKHLRLKRKCNIWLIEDANASQFLLDICRRLKTNAQIRLNKASGAGTSAQIDLGGPSIDSVHWKKADYDAISFLCSKGKTYRFYLRNQADNSVSVAIRSAGH